MALRISSRVLHQKVGDEVVLVNLDDDRIYSLNRTAARIWELLAAGHDPATIGPDAMKPFAVDPERLSADVAALVASLQRAGLLHAG